MFLPVDSPCTDFRQYSAFVGLGLTFVMVPITGAATKSLHGVQHEKMKKTDSRVQIFTDGNIFTNVHPTIDVVYFSCERASDG